MNRIDELRKAVAEYGRRSVENYQLSQDLGRRVIAAFDRHLMTSGGLVLGVPPEGDWNPDKGDYRDAAFSFYGEGLLSIADARFGMSVRIDNLNDKGSLWVRLVVTLRKQGDEMLVFIGDEDSLRLQLPCRDTDIQKICERLADVLLKTFQSDVNVFVHGRERQVTIGFR